MIDPKFLLFSKLKVYKIDAESQYSWFEREKLPKPVQVLEMQKVMIDRNFVENFEW